MRSRGIVGILLGLAAGLAFGAGGAIVKPLLESGWSPGAAVFFRVSVAALILLVPGLIALRFDLRPLWRAKWTVLVYSVIAVAGVQLAFYAVDRPHPGRARRCSSSTSRRSRSWRSRGRARRRAPQLVVLAGSVVAIAGLVLVIGPAGGALDPFGVVIAGVAMLGVAVYYVLGERADVGRAAGRARRGRMPPRRRRRSASPASRGSCRSRPSSSTSRSSAAPRPGGCRCSWSARSRPRSPTWPASSRSACSARGSRRSSASPRSSSPAIVSWALLGEAIGAVQLLGGLLILGGIVLVRLERARARTGGDRPRRSTSSRCPQGADARHRGVRRADAS